MHSFIFWLPILVGLMALSAFCSASEAAYFSLTPDQLRAMRKGATAERRAVRLLETPNRLLSSMLLSNLIANMLYFGIVSVITLQIQETNAALAGMVGVGALLVMIILCELLPKAVAVLIPRTLARLASLPLSGLQCGTAPILPVLRFATHLSKRLIVPNFQSEALLDLADLEQAVALAKGKNSSAPREKELLRALISLSEITAEEMMRPRVTLSIFAPPVTLEDLRDSDRSSGWAFIQEDFDQDALSQVLPLEKLVQIPASDLNNLEKYAENALYVPWNLPVASVLDLLRANNCAAAVVIDEFGATPGVLLLSDILETIFASSSERVFQLTNNQPIKKLNENLWNVSGLYAVRAFCRHFGVEFPSDMESKTLGGLMTDQLQKIPEPNDECDWCGFHFRVLTVEEPAALQLEISRRDSSPSQETPSGKNGKCPTP